MPQPQQSYYPRCTVRLILRFDEFGNDSTLKAKVPEKSTKNLNGLKAPRSPLTAQVDPSAPPGVHRFILAVPGEAASVGGPQDQSQSTDGYTFDVTAIPKTMTWSSNGIQHAATVNCVIKYVDCPIDPRLVRAVGLEVRLGCVTEDAFVATNQHTASPNGEILPDSFVGPSGGTRTNLRFQGFATKWHAEWDEGEPVITIDAQDNSKLLHDQEMPPNVPLSSAIPLDQSVAEFLANFVQLAGLTVEYRPNTDTPPLLKDVMSETALRPKLGPQPSRGGSGQQKQSVWDYLTDVCGSIAHVVRMDGTTIVIQRPRSILTSSIQQRSDDPFEPRTVDNVTFSYRRFLYGRNIKKLGMTRNYGKKCVQNIEVRSQGGNGDKTTVVGRFPLPKDHQVYALPGNTKPDTKWSVYSVPGLKDKATAQKVAQGIYEQMGRQELEVEIKTLNLASFGGDDSDPDILDMKVGDTFEVLVNRDTDNVNDLTRIETALTAQQQNAALMTTLGFSPAFAAAYAKAYTNAGFTTTFRMKTMKIVWNGDKGGVTLDINGANYIEVRADKFLPKGLEPSNSVPKGGA